MLFDKEEVKRQTRQLWKSCFGSSDDFLDIYFGEKYTDESNLTVRVDAELAVAVQVFPYRMTFYNSVVHTGFISGLATAEQFRKKGLATQMMHEAHRKLFKQGALLSFLIPPTEDMRKFFEETRHGSYWTTTFRQLKEIPMSDDIDEKVEITQPDEWGNDLYVFFRQYTKNQPFMLHPSESDFYAALSNCDLKDGWVLVARRKRRILGMCLAVKDSEGRCVLRSLLSADEKVKDCILHDLQKRAGVDKIYARIAAPGSPKLSEPYAMARVINVEKLLWTIATAYPDFQLHVGVDGDLDIPENNGYYFVNDGKVVITDEKPESIVTPGGLAAMFMGSYPTILEMMLDE